jgi:hypothetical protein
MPPALFAFDYFASRVLVFFAQVRPRTTVLLPMASFRAGATDVLSLLLKWSLINFAWAGLKPPSS